MHKLIKCDSKDISEVSCDSLMDAENSVLPSQEYISFQNVLK